MPHPHTPAPRERQLEVNLETKEHYIRGLRDAIARKDAGIVRFEARLVELLANPSTTRAQLRKAIREGFSELRAGP